MTTEMISNIQIHDTYESVFHIATVTNEMTELSDEYGTALTNTILRRPTSCYGYLNVPSNISDTRVLNALQYANDEDTRFATLITRFGLDFVWFESNERKVLVWGETQEKVDEAISAIKTWFCFMVGGYC
jgi:hypothetical protein